MVSEWVKLKTFQIFHRLESDKLLRRLHHRVTFFLHTFLLLSVNWINLFDFHSKSCRAKVSLNKLETPLRMEEHRHTFRFSSRNSDVREMKSWENWGEKRIETFKRCKVNISEMWNNINFMLDQFDQSEPNTLLLCKCVHSVKGKDSNFFQFPIFGIKKSIFSSSFHILKN